MESISKECQKSVASKGNCECDKCVQRKVDKWLVDGWPSFFPLCQQFRKAYFEEDHSTMESLKSSVEDEPCLCCGYNLLHLAISVGSKGLVNWYLSRNYDVEVKTDNEETALHLACVSSDPWFVEHLLVYKAKVDATNGLGCTPLQICLSRDKPSKVILKLLLDHGAKPNNLFRHDEDSVEKIIQANTRNSIGVFPLYDVVHQGWFVMVNRLLKAGACPDSLRCYKRTLLQAACFNGSFLCAKALIRAGVDVNEKDQEGQTALHYAANGGKKEVVKLLVARKCDLDVRDSNGCTALDLAVLNNFLEATTVLLEHGAICSEAVLLKALQLQFSDVVLAILQQGQSRVRDTKFGKAILACALMTKQQKVIDYFEQKTVDKVAVSKEIDDKQDKKMIDEKKRVGEVRKTRIIRNSNKKVTGKKTLKLSDVPQCKQNNCVDDATDSKLKSCQQVRKCIITNKCITTKGKGLIQGNIAKISSSKKDSAVIFAVKSFSKNSAGKTDKTIVMSNNENESKVKLATVKKVFCKKETSKNLTNSVDTFFKFCELGAVKNVRNC